MYPVRSCAQVNACPSASSVVDVDGPHVEHYSTDRGVLSPSGV